MGGATYLNLGTARRGYRAFTALAGKANGFVIDPIDDVVLVRDAGTPANNFCGSMAQALAAGILVYASPSTKYVRNSAGVLVPGTTLRCQYSAAGVPLGFLPEPQRTRLNTYPTQFNNAAWTKNNTTVTPDAVASPISGYSADYIVAATGGGSARDVRRSITASQASAATLSAIVAMKAGECRYLALTIRDSSNAANSNGAEFDLQSGVISIAASNAGTATAGAATVTPFGTAGGISFYRINLSGVIGGGGSAITCVITGRTTSNNNAVADGLGWYMAAAWLEQGAFATSPILGDETTTVTRAADNLYVDLTKVPALGSEFTILGEAEPCPDTAATSFNLFSVFNSSTELLVVRNYLAGVGGLQFVNTTGGSSTGVINVNSAVAASRFKFAAAAKTNNFEIVTGGVSRGTDTSGALMSGATALYLGCNGPGGAGQHWAAPIGFLALIPERLTQADMIARTS